MKKPDFLIIGVAKGGTSSLSSYLSQHPEIHIPPIESHFFDEKEEYEKGLEFYWSKYFQGWKGEKVIGEKRPGNLSFVWVAQRIKVFVPYAKLIAILRNPIERAHSEWWMYVVKEQEKRSFEQALKEGSYLNAGHYAQDLNQYFQFFPREQFKILFLEDLERDPQEVTQEVWKFLGVSSDVRLRNTKPENMAVSPQNVWIVRLARKTGLVKILPRKLKRWGERFLAKPGDRPPIDSSVRKWLREYYYPHNRELETIVHRDLSHWDI
ncbi:MAG: sulfotransferase [Patescibacteria group bacterium]